MIRIDLMRKLTTVLILLTLLLPVAGWTQVEDPQGQGTEETGSGENDENAQGANAETEPGDTSEGLPPNPGAALGCTSYWTGTFQYISKGRKGIKFKRRRKKQIEINQNTGEKAKYKVEWISNCDYILTFKKSNQENKLDKGWTVETKIVDTWTVEKMNKNNRPEDLVFYDYVADQYGIISEGTIQKILSKGQMRRKRRRERRERKKEAKEKARAIEEEQKRLEEEELQKKIANYDEFTNYDPEIAKIIEKRKKEEDKALKKEDKKKFKEDEFARKQAEKEEEGNKSKAERKAEKKRKKEAKKSGKTNIFVKVYDKTLGKLINKIFKKKAKSKVEGEIREIGG